MGIFDSLKKKLKKSKEIETAERAKDAITTSSEKPKTDKKHLTPSEPQPSARVEKAKLLDDYKIKDTSTHKWQDESSREAEERLKEKGIHHPWHYNDTFGEDFKVLALRAGGVGAVFFVKSTRFGERIYAAKTLQRFLQRDYLEMPTYQQKKIADGFLEEALPWLEMGQHPNIVPVHLLENIVHPTTKRNVPFVFSEFMDKGDLKNLLVQKGGFELEEALSAGLQVCEALIHAYKHGLDAHKDLKPDNIMVYREGIYKVTDFSAGIIGTPGYMAPEQVASYFKLKDDVAIDQRADQFAIGIIMLELILGEHPFPWIIRAAYYKEEAKEFLREGVGEIPDNLPGSLRGIIARCLSPDSANRFPDISVLKEALLEVYRNESGRDYCFPEVEIDDSPIWWFNRGLAFHNIGRDADAINPLEKALGMFKGIPKTEIEQILCLINLGNAYADMSTGGFYEAEANYKEALRILESIPEAVIERATCLLDLGGIYLSTDRLYEAEDNLKDALRMFKMRHETEKEQAGCLLNLGLIHRRIGNLSEAENNFKNALVMFKVKPGTERDQARCLLYLGNVYQYIGDANQSIDKFYEAEANYEEALRVLKPIPGTEVEQARCLVNLGVVYEDIGEYLKAEESYKEAVMMFEEIQGMEISQARCLMNLGILYNKIQEFSKARGVLKSALEICERYPMGTEQIKNACLKVLSQIP